MNISTPFTTSSEPDRVMHQGSNQLQMQYPQPRVWPKKERLRLINHEIKPTLPSASRPTILSKGRALPPGKNRRRAKYSPGRILLVDNHPVALGSLTDLLIAKGYFVMPAANGREVLAFANRLRVDLALLDLDVLAQSSRKTFVQLTRDHPHLPVIVTSAHANCLPANVGKGTGNLLKKPIRHLELVRVVKRLLRPSRPARASRHSAILCARRRCATPVTRSLAVSAASHLPSHQRSR